MIGVYVKIPFHAQLKKAESRLADQLESTVADAARLFAASRVPSDESYLITFDESFRPARLCAAEAARLLSSSLEGLGARLFGWFIIVDSGHSPEDLREHANRLWFGLEHDGLYVSSRAEAAFGPYFALAARGSQESSEDIALAVQKTLYMHRGIELEAAIDPPQSSVIDKVVDALGALTTEDTYPSMLALLGPGRAPLRCFEAAVQLLYPGSFPRYLRIRSSWIEGSPYGSLAFASPDRPFPPENQGREEGREAARELEECFAELWRFLQQSPYRQECSPLIITQLRLSLATRLGRYVRDLQKQGLPPLLLLEGAESLSPQCLRIILGLFENREASEGLCLLAMGSGLPEAWTESLKPRYLEIPGPTPVAMAKAAIRAASELGHEELGTPLALVARGDPQRLKLAIRLAAKGSIPDPKTSHEELAAHVLASYPREYSELLWALSLAEDILNDEHTENFLKEAGYVPGIRRLIYEDLASLGFIGKGDRPRILNSAGPRGAKLALAESSMALRSAFVRLLLELRSRRQIIPSKALFRKLSAEAEELGLPKLINEELQLSSILADYCFGDSEPEAAPPLPALHLEALKDFLDAFSQSRQEESEAALERLDLEIEGRDLPLAKEGARLAKAAFEYAQGKVAEAANLAKNSLISLHGMAAAQAESKAHRILGYCALASDQALEASDYFSNAYEIGQTVPSPVDCILAAIAECSANFATGDLGRALERARTASAWARSIFRSDWEANAIFIEGRVSMEIGAYAEAKACFGRVRSLARIYDWPEASLRAEVWYARAASLAGELDCAETILRRAEEDTEALWFLADIALRRGLFSEASELAAQALGNLKTSRFRSPDCLEWEDGFSFLEARAVGCFAARGYLGDQIEAYAAFARGMMLCGTGSGTNPSEEALALADHLAARAREERLAALHPSAHLYLFYRYRILEAAMPASMEATTALSKAFKALQLRSARLEASDLKDGFLEANLWNGMLFEAARAHKLL